MDVGCGTGSLAVALADHFDEVVGIDPDEEMLIIARQKTGLKGETRYAIRDSKKGIGDRRYASLVTLLPLGMLDLEDRFARGSFNVVLCLGNTLVHLAGEEEVRDFLRQTHGVLKPGGSLIIQIINYDRVIDNKLGGLPTIENEQVRFERIYQYPEKPIYITFITRLTIKESGEVIENRVPLLALTPERLRGLLAESGFGGLEEFGSFSREGFRAESQPFILLAKKEERERRK